MKKKSEICITNDAADQLEQQSAGVFSALTSNARSVDDELRAVIPDIRHCQSSYDTRGLRALTDADWSKYPPALPGDTYSSQKSSLLMSFMDAQNSLLTIGRPIRLLPPEANPRPLGSIDHRISTPLKTGI